MEGYKILNLTFSYEGQTQRLFPVVLMSEGERVLVDCGYPGFVELLENAMKEQGIEPETITKILLTHQDDDHMGSAAQWVAKYPHVQVLCGREEKPYIDGTRKSLRLCQAEELQEYLPQEQKAFGEAFCARIRAVCPVKVDQTFQDGDFFPWGGGGRIMATPGHTPGHISVYLSGEDTLICGDAAVAEGGELVVANPQFCLDRPRAEESLKKLRDMACRRYICYHGGMWSN